MAGKEQRQNRAQEAEPRVTGQHPAKAPKHAAGSEREYSNRAFTSERQRISSTSTAHVGADLGAAVDELHDQHPYKPHELGPHHGKRDHDRHEPLHGMHPKARHGR